MTLKYANLNSFLNGIRQHIDKSAVEVEKLRREIADALLTELFKNIPVWSGRTVASIQVSNSSSAPTKETHPDRRNTSKDGPYHFHPEFGFTNRMALGAEPQRARAEATARASLDGADYSIMKRVYVVGNSTAWSLIEKGDAPDHDPHTPRNSGVVSTLAVAAVKSKFGGRVK